MRIIPSSALFFAAVLIAQGQGTFFYDQQSATNGIATFGTSINQGQPIGQAFTPSLSAVGFVQLQLQNNFNLTNATIAVHLWADSLGGTYLGSTEPIALPAGYFALATTFRFANQVAVTPGNTYYFQPVIQLGGNNDWIVSLDYYSYPGDYFFQGVAQPGGLQFWFREGVVVPEPSALLLLGLGLGALLLFRRTLFKRRLPV